jgi:hypothetical protein
MMGRVLAAMAILLLMISVRTVVIGYDSYTPLVFAQLYIAVFALGMTIPVFRRMDRSPAGDHIVLLLVSGFVAAYYFGLVAWDLGGTTYCGGRYILYSVVRVPSVYRCASNPAAAAGWLAGLWIAIWIVEWWSDRMNVDSDRDFAPQRSLLLTVGSVLAVGLLIVAVGTMFVGTRTFRPILFAEMYVLLFALFMSVPTVLRAEESDAGWLMLFSAAFFGGLLAWKLAPQIDGPNFCSPLPPGWRAMRDNARDIARILGVHLPPLVRTTVFRCTPVPLTVIGGFAGWWIAFFASGRRKAVVLS